MRPERRATAEALAGALADGATIDWGAADGLDAGQRDLVRQLRVVAGLRVSGRTRAHDHGTWRRAVAAAYVIAIILAALKVGLAVVAMPDTIASTRDPAQAALFAYNLTIFGIGGLLLIAGGTRDRRLQLLGAFYVVIASAFVKPFFAWMQGPLAFAADLLQPILTESFFAAGVWMFAWSFPREPAPGRLRTGAAVGVTAAVALGWGLLAANVLSAGAGVVGGRHDLPAFIAAFDRQSARSWYWPVLFAVSLAAVPFFVLKLRAGAEDVRTRARRFLLALAIGMAPVVVASVVSPFAPALAEARPHLLDVAVYVGLASIVPMTAYAVGVRRVMTLEFVVRATLQYALARSAIWAAILAPATYLALDVFLHRGLTFLQYLDARHPEMLLAVSGGGLVALTFRPHLARAVDRWFLREPVDAPAAMARLDDRLRGSGTLRDLAAGLADELRAGVHAAHARVLLLAEDGASLVAPDGSAPPLRRDAVLVELARTTGRPLQFDPRSDVTRLLPDDDQDWLQEVGGLVVAPLLGASRALLGVAVLGENLAGLSYTPAHARLVTTMCDHAALQLENRALRQGRPALDAAQAVRAAGVDWQDEPAACCPICSTLAPADTRRCRCGGTPRPSALPLFVCGKFRLRRQLGTGGTGVVYLATDMTLDRQVAIKTLPAVRREFAERLRREARAMASVRHPNLATIYGVEEWRDTPLLVVEYLEGGTLLDVLARGPLSVDEALDLGITLADALDRVHGSDVLHRDLKPSNIGFTHDGVPKLLDFGLAAMLDRSAGIDGGAAVGPDAIDLALRADGRPASSTLTVTNQVVGTPLYLAPEALDGAAPRESFDLWSLAMVLYEAMAGRHPFGGRPLPDVVHAVRHEAVPDLRRWCPDGPAAVAALLADALSPDPARRPRSAADFRTALRALRGPVGPVH